MTDRLGDSDRIDVELAGPVPEGASALAHRHALTAESAPALLALYSAILEELHWARRRPEHEQPGWRLRGAPDREGIRPVSGE